MNSTDTKDRPDIIAWPPLIFLGCAGVGALMHFFYPLRIAPYLPALAIGVVFVAAAGWVALRAERAMHAAGTNVRPDKPALAIVSGGPYRFSRNPMYLALCLMQIGVGFVIDGWIPVLFTIPLALMLHFGVVLREEAYLELKFGETYLQFKRRVRRWI